MKTRAGWQSKRLSPSLKVLPYVVRLIRWFLPDDLPDDEFERARVEGIFSLYGVLLLALPANLIINLLKSDPVGSSITLAGFLFVILVYLASRFTGRITGPAALLLVIGIINTTITAILRNATVTPAVALWQLTAVFCGLVFIGYRFGLAAGAFVVLEWITFMLLEPFGIEVKTLGKPPAPYSLGLALPPILVCLTIAVFMIRRMRRALDVIGDLRRQSEQRLEALKHSEARWHYALWGSEDGVWDWNLADGSVFYSPTWLSMLGYSEHDIPGTIESFNKLLHPLDVERTNTAVAAHLSGESEMYRIEFRLLCADNSYKWILSRGKIVQFDKEGKPLRFIGTHIDLTRHRQLEAELLDRKQTIEDAQRLNKIGDWEFDLQTQELRSSGPMREIWGFGAKEQITMDKFLGSMTGPDANRVMEAIQEGIKTRKMYRVEHPIMTSAGIKHLQSIVQPITGIDGQILRLYGITRDVTEEKRAHDAISSIRKQLEEVLNTQSQLVCRFLPDTTLTFVNTALAFFQNKRKEDLIGTPFLLFLSPEERIPFRARLQTDSDRKLTTVICQFRSSVNSQLSLEWSVVPLYNESGELAEYQASATDLTLQREYERQILEAKRTAENAARVKADFLSTMSHELRTPLNVVIGLANILMLEDPREDQKSHLRILQFSAQNLLALINDILDFNRIESGLLRLENLPVKVTQLTSNVLAGFEQRAREKGIMLYAEIDNTIPLYLDTDPIRLMQILNNLIGNAVKFTESGSVTVVCRLLAIEEGGARVYFAVEDTGIGIPADKLSVIFERFQQASTETTRKFGGTGLGLAITRYLLRLMGSDIEVRSEMNIGSKFSFTLLMPVSETMDIKRIEDDSETSVQNTKVLIVDDNPDNIFIARRYLEKAGAIVKESISGRAALEMLQTETPDVVLMDLQMPEMDGYETVRKVREQLRGTSDLPVIALSAEATSEIREHVLGHGFQDYLSKPYDRMDLLRKVHRWSSKK